MPATTKTRRAVRPGEGFATALLPAHPDRPVRLFLPGDYQSKYAYPLIVLFHADGTDEDAAARLAPQLSRRNYVTVCPRGPVALGPGVTGRPGFGWGRDPRADAYLLQVVAHACRAYHVHSERIYLAGSGFGATAALRLAQALPGGAAGVVSLNGELPERRLKATRGVRVFVGHGAANPVTPLSAARRASRLLSKVGADVRFQSYPTTQHVNEDMLRDVNRWVMRGVNTGADPATILTG